MNGAECLVGVVNVASCRRRRGAHLLSGIIYAMEGQCVAELAGAQGDLPGQCPSLVIIVVNPGVVVVVVDMAWLAWPGS